MATRLPAARQWLMGPFFLAASAFALRHMVFGPAAVAANDDFAVIAQNEDYHFSANGVKLRRGYTGIRALDSGLSFLVAAFLPGAAGWDRNFQLLQAYFLFSFFSVLAIWSIEAARTRNKSRVISYTTLWAVPYQTIGGAIAIPLWFLCYVISTSDATYWNQHPVVSPIHAKALLPALTLGYLVPTALVFFPYQDLHARQAAVALWQVSPFLVNFLWYILARLLPNQAMQERKSSVQQQRDSLPWLKAIYITASSASACTHWTVIYLVSASKLQLRTVFIPEHHAEWTMTSALLFIFQIDFWVIFACTTAWSLLAAWDEDSRQNASRVGFYTAALLISVCTVCFGPGAALSLTWYRRELNMNHEQGFSSKSKAK